MAYLTGRPQKFLKNLPQNLKILAQKTIRRPCLLIPGGFLFLLDRILKYFALTLDTPKPLIADVVSWQPTLNSAGVFSLPINNFWLVLISAPLILLILFWIYYTKNNHPSLLAPILLLLMGALSNFFDRLVYGGVIDYLYIFWGTINLADILIIAGVVFYIFTFNKGEHVFKT